MTVTTLSAAATDVILAFADDEHLMGQQHTEWIGVAPFLEEDLAFASVGQDELGHAALLISLIVGDDDQQIDEMAFYRDPADWRSCALSEISLPDWGDTLVRHWMYDAAEQLRWALFADSTVDGLASIATRALHEERFHLRHADALLDALLDVDAASARIEGSVERLLPLAIDMFAGAPLEAEAIAEGVVADSFHSCLDPWRAAVDARFGAQDWSQIAQPGQRRSDRSDDFAPLLARMREVLDLDRSAIW